MKNKQSPHFLAGSIVAVLVGAFLFMLNQFLIALFGLPYKPKDTPPQKKQEEVQSTIGGQNVLDE